MRGGRAESSFHRNCGIGARGHVLFKGMARKLLQPRIWKEIMLQRLTEPLHLNALCLPVALFGGFQRKVTFDLVMRQEYAFGLLKAADIAKSLGISEIAALEFGVGNGAGLLNMAALGSRVAKETGVMIRTYGFDTGVGMPPPKDHRDHPEYYFTGDFPMGDKDRLIAALPEEAEIIIGDVGDTAKSSLEKISCPIGFISVDVDYYSSALDCLEILKGDAGSYLPYVVMYFDDIEMLGHSPFAGELLAIDDFNAATEMRKINPYGFLAQNRVFSRAKWIQHMFVAQIFDHPHRQIDRQRPAQPKHLQNPYFE